MAKVRGEMKKVYVSGAVAEVCCAGCCALPSCPIRPIVTSTHRSVSFCLDPSRLFALISPSTAPPSLPLLLQCDPVSPVNPHSQRHPILLLESKGAAELTKTVLSPMPIAPPEPPLTPRRTASTSSSSTSGRTCGA